MVIFVLAVLFCITNAAPQQPEINDQFEKANQVEFIKTIDDIKETVNKNVATIEETKPTTENTQKTEIMTQLSFTARLYKKLTTPVATFISQPKVSSVLRNIGTCIVNGAMEIVSHYFPAPFIPLIASAAGMVIPFEPVVMLKEKMPVTSYRRAFHTAMNTFLGTFDKYKVDNEDDDPYMTRRFNRRFMNSLSGERNTKDFGGDNVSEENIEMRKNKNKRID